MCCHSSSTADFSQSIICIGNSMVIPSNNRLIECIMLLEIACGEAQA